jgi:hypothetical protein
MQDFVKHWIEQHKFPRNGNTNPEFQTFVIREVDLAYFLSQYTLTPKMRRVVYGISDWPESFGKEFEIVDVRPDETDEQAITRAKSHYGDDLVCEIREVAK